MGFRSTSSSHAKALEIGERIKQARLNKDLTQVEISEISGLERRAIINAEKGKVTLENLIAYLDALNMRDQIDLFLPPQPISPIQLHKLQGKERKKASGEHKANSNNKKILTENKDDFGW